MMSMTTMMVPCARAAARLLCVRCRPARSWQGKGLVCASILLDCVSSWRSVHLTGYRDLQPDDTSEGRSVNTLCYDGAD